MAAIGGVAYLTSGTGVPAYLLSRAAMSATSMALDPRLRRQWAVGDWPGALAASQAHLPFWGPLHNVSDAVGRRDYVQGALHTGVFALDAAGLRYAGRQPGRLPKINVEKFDHLLEDLSKMPNNQLMSYCKQLELKFIRDKAKLITRSQADLLVKEARKRGIYVRIDKGHPKTEWEMPHLNIGGKDGTFHIPIKE